MNVIELVQQYAKMLKHVDRWLDKAVEHAKKKSFDVETLVHARLAPDMYSLDRQIQSACDTAKFSASYLSGKQPPVHPDTEKTFAELRARIQSCLAFLETIGAADVAGAEDRKVTPKWLQGKWVKGDQFLVQVSLPNFYFHVTTAYAILRHNGVDLGKNDFIGAIPQRD
ncbi:MAG TPA: DUF1993 domain-containing protein [Polyangia bacterium]|nr:DUF1993 domain-containing protein [Polyangia bacterium]